MTAKVPRRTQQHGRVAVVPAGMHLTVRCRSMVACGPLNDRQGIHIRPQPHRAPLAPRSPKGSNDAGLTQPTVHFETPIRETTGNQVSRTNLLESEFRMRVDVAPQSDQLVFKNLDCLMNDINGSDHDRCSFACGGCRKKRAIIPMKLVTIRYQAMANGLPVRSRSHVTAS